MATIEDLRQAVVTVSETVGRSVVGVGHRWAQGSGVVVARGKVLTNAHNLRHEEVTVTFSDGRTVTGRSSGVDVEGDLAVLDADTGDAPAVAWDGAAPASLGTPVFALADPGGRGLRVTFGLVSGTDRAFRGPRGARITGALEHTAPLLPGSSGGPVVDASGRLLGLNTNRLGEGFYLAIAADRSLKERVDALSRGESPSRPRLGVGIAPPQVAARLRAAVGLPEMEGLLVRQVEKGSPAERAGLNEGDLIVSAAGAALAGIDDLSDALRSAGATIELGIVRGVQERQVTVSLNEPESA